MIVYKLTDENMQTYEETQWALCETKTANKLGPLCGPNGFHAYPSVELAVLMNPAHVDFSNPRLFRAEGSDEMITDGTKTKHKSLTLLEELTLPKVTLNQRIYFAIRCALEVCKDSNFVQWANDWISGKDRTAESAKVIGALIGEAARGAYWDAYRFSGRPAAWAISAIAKTIWSAAKAARVTAWAAEAADWAAEATARVTAWAAEASAKATVRANKNIDLIQIAKEAIAWKDANNYFKD